MMTTDDDYRWMPADSLQLREQVLWYTSLVGRKSSLQPLLKQLRQSRVPDVRTTELAQGRTSRWALTWSFVEATAPSAAAPQPRAQCRNQKPAEYSKFFSVAVLAAAEVRRRLF